MVSALKSLGIIATLLGGAYSQTGFTLTAGDDGMSVFWPQMQECYRAACTDGLAATAIAVATAFPLSAPKGTNANATVQTPTRRLR
jgi:hypothetical protein